MSNTDIFQQSTRVKLEIVNNARSPPSVWNTSAGGDRALQLVSETPISVHSTFPEMEGFSDGEGVSSSIVSKDVTNHLSRNYIHETAAHYDFGLVKQGRPSNNIELNELDSKLCQKYSRKDVNGPSESDFGFIHLLSEGGFGKVVLAKSYEHNSFCAIKIMNKKQILHQHMGTAIVRERTIMSFTNK